MTDSGFVRMPDSSLTHPDAALSTISASVRSSDNRPVSNAKVEIRNITNGTAVAFGYTGPSGDFQVNNLPRGAYEVVATSGLSEAREEVRIDNSMEQLTLRLPNTSDSTFSPGQQTVSAQELRVPEKAQAALRKAQSCAEKGKYDEARQQIAKALNIEPKYSEAIAYRGVINMETGDLNSASDDLQKAIQFDNNDALAYVAMGSLYNMRSQFDDSLRELDRAVALTPTAWQVHFEISKAELGKADFSTALKEAEKAQSLLGRELAALHVIKGQAFFGMKSYADAVAEFQKFLSENQDKDSPIAAQVRKSMESAEAFTEARK